MRVELRGVSKRFGRVEALRDLNLSVESGSRAAIIGPNGSGKSTLTRILMGMLTCEGEVRLDGRCPFRERADLAPRMAYVPQVAPNLSATVREVVAAVARLRVLDPTLVASTAGELHLDLDVIARQPFRNLSGGMRQKLLAALALSSRSSLLILDEPTASMDADSRRQFFRMVEQQNQNPTVLLCSHRLEEIRHLVDQVVMLQDGSLQWQGPATDYVSLHATSMLEVRAVPAADSWLVANGFERGHTGWWTRRIPNDERLDLVRVLTRQLGASLRDLVVRDQEGLACSSAPESLEAS
jgi:ABC-type multidrug transport system ATPase subunit